MEQQIVKIEDQLRQYSSNLEKENNQGLQKILTNLAKLDEETVKLLKEAKKNRRTKEKQKLTSLLKQIEKTEKNVCNIMVGVETKTEKAAEETQEVGSAEATDKGTEASPVS